MVCRSRGVVSTDRTDGRLRRGAAPSPAGTQLRNIGALRRVVVAEDDPDISALVALALGRVGGLEVTICANGRAVLELVPHHLPDLFLLDVMMPEMDGLETLARLALEPSTAAIPVIFMTARVRPRDLEVYFAEGAAGVIAKPFDPMTLARHLRRLHAENRHVPD
jgi:two-component system, OmpR family, response regulator